MKYLKTVVLSCSENKNEKNNYRADIKLITIKKLQSGQTVEAEQILTISSAIKLMSGEQILRVKSEYNFQNKLYITVDETLQKLEIKKPQNI